MINQDLMRQSLSAFLAQALQNTQQTPHAGSPSLVIADQKCGSIFPPAAQILREHFPTLFSGSALVISSNLSRDQIDQQLNAFSQCLLNAGCLPKWRDELLDVWAGDQSIAAIERGAVRALGLVTRAVHLNAWSESGDLWVARRALDKATDPGLWDTLVGGLVGLGEGDDLALVRETAEEAGLDERALAHRTPLRVITRMQRRLPEGFQCEDVITCECVLPLDVVPENQDGEVMTIVALPPKEVAQMLLDNVFTVEAGIVISQELLDQMDRRDRLCQA
jgi:8-oxo-dGTP pyrophosphatase MutT (NUDIX family)